MGLRLDASEWPLLVVSGEGGWTDAQHVEYLASLAAYAKKQEPWAVLWDGESFKQVPSREDRRRQSAFFNDYGKLIGLHCAGMAFVLPTAVLRGTLWAVLWMSPLKCPYDTLKTVAEGRAWCLDRLRERGVG